MTLAESSASFLAEIKQNESYSSKLELRVHEKAISLLSQYFSKDTGLSEISPARLRDFIARWYVERARACASNQPDGESAQTKVMSEPADLTSDSQELDKQDIAFSGTPKPSEVLSSLSQFFKWIDQHEGGHLDERSTSVLRELTQSLPRALEITTVLSGWLRERGGAFGFPEFLTSFEEGGRSEYDIDTPSSVGALEGYFRILRVEGSSVEAEELISEDRVWPIVFPPEVAALLDDQYIINLELVRTPAGWQIAGCGFAYPPGTDV